MPLALPEVSRSAEVYDLVETTTRDLPLWLALARAAAGPVLELGCGTGRVTWALGRAGADVTGVDLCPDMLARAEAKRPPGVVVRLERADLRALALPRRFALAIAPARVLELVELEPALDAVRRHLLPGGRLALHVAPPPGAGQPDAAALLVRRDAGGEVVWQERLDRARRVRHVVVTHRAPSGEARGFGPLALRWYAPGELEGALARAGFELELDPALEAAARAAEPGLAFVVGRVGPCR